MSFLKNNFSMMVRALNKSPVQSLPSALPLAPLSIDLAEPSISSVLCPLVCPHRVCVQVLTGAKGSAVNQSQISCFLGQQVHLPTSFPDRLYLLSRPSRLHTSYLISLSTPHPAVPPLIRPWKGNGCPS